eukprot:CAMPEP_0178451672 /NCGR_PEP_ID=MMETSP0689_2-20121128/43814_1 /TAXON_ID=160604 /ORGANISM="Amphidinium massartii, Strain CS-259" /LENGTH=706 /DNA_ID=CAMNT_0020077283 /DNA_START=44 /DNA_END=2161 /DNA_ORIENTATION=-
MATAAFESAAAEHLQRLQRSLAFEHERLAWERERELRRAVAELQEEILRLRYSTHKVISSSASDSSVMGHAPAHVGMVAASCGPSTPPQQQPEAPQSEAVQRNSCAEGSGSDLPLAPQPVREEEVFEAQVHTEAKEEVPAAQETAQATDLVAPVDGQPSAAERLLQAAAADPTASGAVALDEAEARTEVEEDAPQREEEAHGSQQNLTAQAKSPLLRPVSASSGFGPDWWRTESLEPGPSGADIASCAAALEQVLRLTSEEFELVPHEEAPAVSAEPSMAAFEANSTEAGKDDAAAWDIAPKEAPVAVSSAAEAKLHDPQMLESNDDLLLESPRLLEHQSHAAAEPEREPDANQTAAGAFSGSVPDPSMELTLLEACQDVGAADASEAEQDSQQRKQPQEALESGDTHAAAALTSPDCPQVVEEAAAAQDRHLNSEDLARVHLLQPLVAASTSELDPAADADAEQQQQCQQEELETAPAAAAAARAEVGGGAESPALLQSELLSTNRSTDLDYSMSMNSIQDPTCLTSPRRSGVEEEVLEDASVREEATPAPAAVSEQDAHGVHTQGAAATGISQQAWMERTMSPATETGVELRVDLEIPAAVPTSPSSSSTFVPLEVRDVTPPPSDAVRSGRRPSAGRELHVAKAPPPSPSAVVAPGSPADSRHSEAGGRGTVVQELLKARSAAARRFGPSYGPSGRSTEASGSA